MLSSKLARFHYELLENLRPTLDANALTLTQFFLLSFLKEASRPLPMNIIAKEMLQSTAAATSSIDILEKKGLAKRSPDKFDRRKILVTLTRKGLKSFHSAQNGRADYLSGLLSSLSANERAQWIVVEEKVCAIQALHSNPMKLRDSLQS